MKKEIKMLEVGTLLTENDAEYDSYNFVYGGEYGYFNENNILYKTEDTNTAIEYARKYVKDGVNMTYAILTNQGVFDYNEDEFDDSNLEHVSGGTFNAKDVEYSFNAEDVEYSIVKINGTIIEEYGSIEKAREKWKKALLKNIC